jgi:hypothetical protein
MGTSRIKINIIIVISICFVQESNTHALISMDDALVARIRKRNACRILLEKSSVKLPFGRRRRISHFNIVTYRVFAWPIIMGSRFDDWIYWHFFTITLHYNCSHIELIPNDVCLFSRCLVTLQQFNPQILSYARPFINAGEPKRNRRPQGFYYCCSCLRCAGYAAIPW